VPTTASICTHALTSSATLPNDTLLIPPFSPDAFSLPLSYPIAMLGGAQGEINTLASSVFLAKYQTVFRSNHSIAFFSPEGKVRAGSEPVATKLRRRQVKNPPMVTAVIPR
jgi:hypothetical protein